MHPFHKISLSTLSQTQHHGAQLAELLKPGDVLFLEGELGVGKTAFAGACIRAWANDPGLLVPSPTFNVLFPYHASGKGELWHVDLYRLETQDSRLDALGLEEALGNHILLIEWPGRLGESWKKDLDPLYVHLAWSQDGGVRQLTYQGAAAWQDRLKALGAS